MGLKEVKKVFTESEIVLMRGGYVQEMETALAISTPDLNNEPSKIQSILKIYDGFVRSFTQISNPLFSQKSYTVRMHISKAIETDEEFTSFLDELFAISKIATDSVTIKDAKDFIVFLLTVVIPFKATQKDMNSLFRSKLDITPMKIEYYGLMKNFVMSVLTDTGRNNAFEIASSIIAFLKSIYKYTNISQQVYLNNIFYLFVLTSDYAYKEAFVSYMEDTSEGKIISEVETYFNMEESTGDYKELNLVDVYESPSPVLYEDSDTIMDSTEKLILLFGDNIFETSDNLKVKEEIRHLNRDTIRNLLPPEMPGNVLFNLDPQFKMYLKEELQCRIMVSQIQRYDQIDEITMVEYEGEKFLLFKLDSTPDEIHGISMNVGTDYNTARKLVTFYKDDEMEYKFIDEM